MKNIFLTLSIFILILFTAIIKNTSKNLETEIYNIEENISILDEKYETTRDYSQMDRALNFGIKSSY